MADDDAIETYAEVEALVGDAIGEAANRGLGHFAPGSLVLSWVTVVDIIRPDGERELLLIEPDDLPWWTRDGMIKAASSLGSDQETLEP